MSDHINAFKALTLARKVIGRMISKRLEQINVISFLGDGESGIAMAECLVAAAHAALFQLPRVTDKPPEKANFQYAEATVEGNNLVRWLTHLPATI